MVSTNQYFYDAIALKRIMAPVLLRHCLLQVTNPLSWLQSVSNLPFIQSVLPKFLYENSAENVKAFPRSSHLTSSLISHHPHCQAFWSKMQFKLAKHGFPLINQYWLLLIAYLFFMCLQLGLQKFTMIFPGTDISLITLQLPRSSF